MENWLLKNSVMTLAFLAFAFAIRVILTRYIKSREKTWTTQQKLRWLNYVKSGTVIGFFLLSIYVWGEQIQGFAVSFLAIGFAIVFTVKETLSSLNGAFLRWQGHSYEVGDRIALKEYRGDVIDISLLTTTILEVGKVTNNPLTSGMNNCPTGKKIVFPNSLLLNETIVNESYLGHYQMIDFSLALSRQDDWNSAYELLYKIVNEECSGFIEQARNRMKQLEKIRSVDLPPIEPKVIVSLAEKNIIRLTVRCPTPSYQKEKMEQSITKRFLQEFFPQKEKRGKDENLSSLDDDVTDD